MAKSLLFNKALSVCCLVAYVAIAVASVHPVSALASPKQQQQREAVLPITTQRDADQQQLPSSQCGWPAVYPGGHFGPPTVKLAQYLLGYALNATSVNANGDFTSNTTAQIKAFQAKAGITADGFLGPITWSALVKNATTIRLGDKNFAVSAMQTALASNGYPANVTGLFDAPTSVYLRQFQQERGDSITSGFSTDEQTWHLLATGCNQTGGAFWFDVGWPQGSYSLETLQCLRNVGGFKFATFECWLEEGPQGTFWSECVQNIANAWAAGFEAVGVYMFAQRYYDPAPQVRWLLGNLSAHNVKYQAIMFDIEGSKWGQYTHEENRQFITGLRNEFESATNNNVNLTVYCGDEWPDFFGENFTSFSDLPLIYAHYDNVPSFYDFFPTYGGWTRPAGKQFWDGSGGESICGTGELDWDWSSKSFW